MMRKIGKGVAELTEADRSDFSLAKISAAPPLSQLRWQPAILGTASKKTVRFAECAGRTTAECAAICCCFPCGLLNLLVLAAVRLPAGICRRVIRKRIVLRRSKKKAAILRADSVKARWSVEDESDSVEFAGMKVVKVVAGSLPWRSPAAEVVEMEEAVWSRFHHSGFWRTPSLGEGR